MPTSPAIGRRSSPRSSRWKTNLAQTRILSQQVHTTTWGGFFSANASLNLEMGRYQTGIDPYIDVVTLQNTLLSNQQSLASLQIEQMSGRRAVGGGPGRWVGYFPATYAGASHRSRPARRIQRFSNRDAWRASTCSTGCPQPQSYALVGRRKTELVRKSLAAGCARRRMKSSKRACGFFGERPLHFDAIGMRMSAIRFSEQCLDTHWRSRKIDGQSHHCGRRAVIVACLPECHPAESSDRFGHHVGRFTIETGQETAIPTISLASVLETTNLRLDDLTTHAPGPRDMLPAPEYCTR